jgi:hypothetical protein
VGDQLGALGAEPRGDQRVIDEFLGYQTEAMRKRYRRLFQKDRRSAIESITYALLPEDPGIRKFVH